MFLPRELLPQSQTTLSKQAKKLTNTPAICAGVFLFAQVETSVKVLTLYTFCSIIIIDMYYPFSQEMPDPIMAAASAEAFEPGGFKLVTDESAGYPAGAGFPPVPSEVVAITPIYIDGINPGLRTQYFNSNPGLASHADVADLYAKTVGKAQEEADIVFEGFRLATQDVQQWYVERAERSGKRLMAAHVVAVTLSSRELIDAIAVPSAVQSELPLMLRDRISSTLPLVDEALKAGVVSKDESEAFLAHARRVMRNEPEMLNTSVVAAASLLPKADVYSRILRAQPAPPQQQPGQFRSRKLRRKNR
jgi:hypothetical protein